jgi:uncharacterized protein YpbB
MEQMTECVLAELKAHFENMNAGQERMLVRRMSSKKSWI